MTHDDPSQEHVGAGAEIAVSGVSESSRVGNELKSSEKATSSQFDSGWKARAQKELLLMGDLLPLLKKRAGGREIAGLKAYEDAR